MSKVSTILFSRCFFLISTLSAYLFSLDIKVALVNSGDLQLVNGLMDLKVAKTVYVRSDLAIIEISQEWLSDFRRQRTKELQLKREELKALRRLILFPEAIKDKDYRLNIQFAIEAYYEKLIPQREREELLDTHSFLQLYEGKAGNLLKDIRATNRRLSGISY